MKKALVGMGIVLAGGALIAAVIGSRKMRRRKKF